jgi:hypothetical protein
MGKTYIRTQKKRTNRAKKLKGASLIRVKVKRKK